MSLDEPAATRTFVAMLVAHVHGTPLDTARIVPDLSRVELVYILGVALGMLAHEVRLGCADAGIPVDEYLAMLGLAAAS